MALRPRCAEIIRSASASAWRGARDLLLEAHAPQLLGVTYLRPSCSPMIAIARGLARFLDAIQPPVGDDFPGNFRDFGVVPNTDKCAVFIEGNITLARAACQTL